MASTPPDAPTTPPGVSVPSNCDTTRVCTNSEWLIGNATAVFWYGPFFTIAQPQQQMFSIHLFRVNDPVAEAANVAPTSFGPQADQCNPIGASIVHTWTANAARSDPDVLDAFKVWPNSGGLLSYALISLTPVADLARQLPPTARFFVSVSSGPRQCLMQPDTQDLVFLSVPRSPPPPPPSSPPALAPFSTTTASLSAGLFGLSMNSSLAAMPNASAISPSTASPSAVSPSSTSILSNPASPQNSSPSDHLDPTLSSQGESPIVTSKNVPGSGTADDDDGRASNGVRDQILIIVVSVLVALVVVFAVLTAVRRSRRGGASTGEGGTLPSVNHASASAAAAGVGAGVIGKATTEMEALRRREKLGDEKGHGGFGGLNPSDVLAMVVTKAAGMVEVRRSSSTDMMPLSGTGGCVGGSGSESGGVGAREESPAFLVSKCAAGFGRSEGSGVMMVSRSIAGKGTVRVRADDASSCASFMQRPNFSVSGTLSSVSSSAGLLQPLAAPSVSVPSLLPPTPSLIAVLPASSASSALPPAMVPLPPLSKSVSLPWTVASHAPSQPNPPPPPPPPVPVLPAASPCAAPGALDLRGRTLPPRSRSLRRVPSVPLNEYGDSSESGSPFSDSEAVGCGGAVGCGRDGGGAVFSSLGVVASPFDDAAAIDDVEPAVTLSSPSSPLPSLDSVLDGWAEPLPPPPPPPLGRLVNPFLSAADAVMIASAFRRELQSPMDLDWSCSSSSSLSSLSSSRSSMGSRVTSATGLSTFFGPARRFGDDGASSDASFVDDDGGGGGSSSVTSSFKDLGRPNGVLGGGGDGDGGGTLCDVSRRRSGSGTRSSGSGGRSGSVTSLSMQGVSVGTLTGSMASSLGGGSRSSAGGWSDEGCDRGVIGGSTV
ncbi:hypothetical protein HDU67_008564 [Dinochytrium kinnereticum]|nr:hypothetical protein HDU67_008564 [Dinochytrium kinnereticum]